jgi:uncharacterized protein with PQ loop repeat
MVVTHQIHAKKHLNNHSFLDEYMHMRNLKHKIGKSIYLLGFIGPLVTIPQIIRIWVRKSAEDISMLTWLGYLIFGIAWLMYGIIYKDRYVILGSVLWMVMYLLIIAGKVMYG